MKKWFFGLLLLAASIPVVSALFKPGFYVTHDGEFNLVRLMHFNDALRNGQFPVRWVNGLNFGFGSPLFNFFYPLMYYLSSLIHLFGFDFGTSLKALIGASSVGSVILMYIWLRKRFSDFGAFFGAMIFLYAPYRLLLMYVTGTFGALLSLFFLPLVFISIDKIIEKKRIFVSVLALGILGLLTAHNVTALILLPLSICYAGFMILISKTGKSHLREIGLGFVLGFGLSAFFVIPALTETNLVHLSEGVVVNFRDHFPTFRQLIYSKWGYFYSVPGINDEMSFQLGVGQWAVVGITSLIVVLQLFRKMASDEKDKLAWIFLLLFFATILMMLQPSQFIWEKFSILSQIQFPWRILAASIFIVPILGAYISSKRFGKVFALLIIGLLLFSNRNNLRTWETLRYPDSFYFSKVTLFNGSTDIAGESKPIWVKVGPSWLAKNIVEENPMIKIGSQIVLPSGNIEVATDSTLSANLILNRFYYPVWRAQVDDKRVDIKPTDNTGLISIPLSAGKHDVKVSYQETKNETLADSVSIVSLVVLFFLAIRATKK